jgi:hypothetical protein
VNRVAVHQILAGTAAWLQCSCVSSLVIVARIVGDKKPQKCEQNKGSLVEEWRSVRSKRERVLFEGQRLYLISQKNWS